MTRKSKPDRGVSETDVSPKKTKIQKKRHRYLTKPDKIVRSYKCGHYALTAQCRLFKTDGIAGGASLRNRVSPYVGRAWRSTCMYMGLTDAIQQPRLGINIFHGEHYWQGFFSYYIAVAKLFLNSKKLYILVVTLSFSWSQLLHWKLFISSSVFPPLLSPAVGQQYFHTFLVVTMSLLVSILTSMQHLCVGKSIGS